MTKKFKVGDIVQLKSGGPIMTVDDIDLYPDIYARWFVSADNIYHEDSFSADSLIKIKRNSFVLKIILSLLPPKKDHDNSTGNKKSSKINVFLPFIKKPKTLHLSQTQSNDNFKSTKEILNQDTHQLQYITKNNEP